MSTYEYDLAEGEGVVCETDSGPLTILVVEVDQKNEEIFFSIDGPPDLKVILESGRPREIWGTPKCKGMPRLWLLFSLILPHSIRGDVFLPTFNEFVEDYVLARRKYRRKWDKRWLSVVFTVRTLGMIGTCLRIQSLSGNDFT